MKFPGASKAYASGIGAVLVEPVQSFVTGVCLWVGAPEEVCTPLGIIIAVGVSFALTYFIPNGIPE